MYWPMHSLPLPSLQECRDKPRAERSFFPIGDSVFSYELDHDKRTVHFTSQGLDRRRVGVLNPKELPVYQCVFKIYATAISDSSDGSKELVMSNSEPSLL
jgi:hypothetical protein